MPARKKARKPIKPQKQTWEEVSAKLEEMMDELDSEDRLKVIEGFRKNFFDPSRDLTLDEYIDDMNCGGDCKECEMVDENGNHDDCQVMMADTLCFILLKIQDLDLALQNITKLMRGDVSTFGEEDEGEDGETYNKKLPTPPEVSHLFG